jgi:hypothetical protein
MVGGHGAAGALGLGHEPGQDVALQSGQAFMGHGHLFASDVRGRSSSRRLLSSLLLL